jgi:hypothetical protein
MTHKSKPPEPKVHTQTTATLLAFAEPPSGGGIQGVANDCTRQGFNAIGITNLQPSDIIDFSDSQFDQKTCNDLGDAIEICVDSKGFTIPNPAGSFDVMHDQGTRITFANLAAALAKRIS